MNTTPGSQNQEVSPVHPGVYANPAGGYTVHLKRNDRVLPVLGSPAIVDELAPADTPTLAGISVFEDCVTLALESGDAILLHSSDPKARLVGLDGSCSPLAIQW